MYHYYYLGNEITTASTVSREMLNNLHVIKKMYIVFFNFKKFYSVRMHMLIHFENTYENNFGFTDLIIFYIFALFLNSV